MLELRYSMVIEVPAPCVCPLCHQVHAGDVAIKRLEASSSQGQRELLMEIEVLSRCHHPNLLRLVGVCNEVRRGGSNAPSSMNLFLCSLLTHAPFDLCAAWLCVPHLPACLRWQSRGSARDNCRRQAASRDARAYGGGAADVEGSRSHLKRRLPRSHLSAHADGFEARYPPPRREAEQHPPRPARHGLPR